MTIVPSIRSNFMRSAVFALSFISSIPWTNAESLSWNGWTLVYEVSGNFDGLSLANVMYQNHSIIRKISLPVVRVFYDNNECGPYADRLGGTLSPIPWADNATIARREFTQPDGRRWYELGIRDQIGSYDIYQVYYLSEDGIIDAHIFSKGLQCVVNHIHYPNWRIDFDIDGSNNDQIQFDTGTAYQTSNTEFNANATAAVNHGWRVRDSATGSNVDILPGFTDFTIPDGNGVVAVTDYSNHTVFGRLYKTAEDTGWTYGPNTQVPFGNGEPIDNQNNVFWYEGYLPHSAAEGSNLWHSTGVRLAVNASSIPPPPPPSNTQSFANNAAITIADNSPAAPYPSTINVSGMTGAITDVEVTLNGVRHTYPDDIDVLLVGPAGQKLLLMSDTGGSTDLEGSILTFRDDGFSLPDSNPISTGTYLPTNFGTGDAFGAPAPPGPYGASLTAFNQTSPNGNWQLFVIDDEGADIGTIDNGWTITIGTSTSPPDTEAPTVPGTPALTAVSASQINLSWVASTDNVGVTGYRVERCQGASCSNFAQVAAPSGTTYNDVGLSAGTSYSYRVRATDAAGNLGSYSNVASATTASSPSNTQSFTNNAAIAIQDVAPASAYPSTINVSGMTGAITGVEVTLTGVRHTYPDDLDLLLVGPNGQKLLLMSDTGGSTDLEGSILTFRSSASNSLPNSTPISSGTYRPTNFGTGDAFGAPAPPSPYGASLTVFNQTSPNGNWQLFVMDDEALDIGTIDNGWTISVTTN